MVLIDFDERVVSSCCVLENGVVNLASRPGLVWYKIHVGSTRGAEDLLQYKSTAISTHTRKMDGKNYHNFLARD